MSEGHSHGKDANARQLTTALALTGTFLVVEVIYAFLSGSLALLSDAGHMLTDVMALALSLFAIRVGQRPADLKRTFGYRRTEILAAALNAGMLFAIGIYILFEAYKRLREPVEVQTTPMLIVATLGLLVNIVSARILVSGSQGSLNVKSAYLEVMGDLLGSVAVIAGALLIRLTGMTWIDPVLGALIGLWVLPRTWTLLKASVNVLLEGVPDGLDLDALRAEIGRRRVPVMLRRGLDRDRCVHRVLVARDRVVAQHEGDLAGVLLAQVFDHGVRRAARLALEIEKLHQRDLAVQCWGTQPVTVVAY